MFPWKPAADRIFQSASIARPHKTIMKNHRQGASMSLRLNPALAYAILCLLFHISVLCIKCTSSNNQIVGKPNNSNDNSNNNTNNNVNNITTSSSSVSSAPGVDDILKDTIMLLDALDQKLASVNNRTPSALMRDNLRALDSADEQQSVGELQASKNEATADISPEEASIEEALVRLADGFSSGRKVIGDSGTGEPMVSAAAEPQPVVVDQSESSSLVLDKGPSSSSSPSLPIESRGTKRDARQLSSVVMQAVGDDNNQLASDSTERHIKFTLDLMQSIFSSQSYSSKTNLIESFLISPLSIQMVLMMMHLGARGQTRREISNCLHLAQQQPATASLLQDKLQQQAGLAYLHSTEASDSSSKLKRRHHQQPAAEPPAKFVGIKQQSATSQQRQQQSANGPNTVHELFGAAMRQLLKDPIVMKALTSANQIFLQKNLPLAPQYEWAIKHYYAADVKLVDFQHQSSSSSTNVDKTTGSKLGQTASEQSQAAGYANSTTSSSSGTSGLNGTTASEHQHPENIQQMVNDWVERQTKGRISNFLSSPISTSTLMMAINVLYFKGDWQYKFDPSDTETDSLFTQANGKSVKIPMMVSRLPLAFAHDPAMKTSVIELPYKAQRLGLFLLLPDEVSGIFHTMQMLNSTSFANLISSMRKPSHSADQASNGINVRIPKFSIESTPRLSQILSQQLGLKSLFMPDSADLSGMFAPIQPASSHHRRASTTGGVDSASLSSGQQQADSTSTSTTTTTGSQQQQPGIPLQVGLDELLHKAVLQVDEQGSVAAASSATIVERVGLFNSNYFEADHPFLLFLMDKQTGLVLFSGVFAGNNQQQHSNNNLEPAPLPQRRSQTQH